MRWLSAGIVTCALLASPVQAETQAVTDANAGLDAFGRFDYNTAELMITKALREGGLSDSDRELAFLTLAKVFAAEKRYDLALVNLNAAAQLDPNDKEIPPLRAAIASAVPPPTLEAALSALRLTLEKHGTIDFTSHYFDPLTNSDVATPYHGSVSDVRTDAHDCSLTYKLSLPGQENVVLISLPAVGTIDVIPILEVMPPVDVAPGRTLRPTRTDPPGYVVRILMPGYPQNSLFLPSEQAGVELRNAIMDAAKQCKG